MTVDNETTTGRQTDPPEPTPPGQDQYIGDQRATTVRGAFQAYVTRVKGGDMGPLPAVLGLAALFVVFSILRPDSFTSELNIANLLTQASAISVLAMGLVPVLLMGDIDLSAGVAGGVAAGVMGIGIDRLGYAWYVAALGAVLTGVVIGFVIGLLVARLGIPSFVVTLAFFLGLQGVILKLIGQGGSIPVRDGVIRAVTIKSMPVAAGWIIVVAIIALFGFMLIRRHLVQVRTGLQHGPFVLVLAKVVALGAVLVLVTAVLSANRSRGPVPIAGIPYAVFVVGALLLAWGFVFSKTSYGRHVYAAGGSREAARRAGINVQAIRISVFMICSGMAAVSGMITASYDGKVSPGSGGGNVLLYAVGAAVIGGTSLFGGKGKVRDAVIGGLVIATIANGLGLLNQASYINFVVTGAVLLLAASVDAVSRRRRSSTGT